MKKEIKYVFNHFYRLRHDLKRTHIISEASVSDVNECIVRKDWLSTIHPIYAMIFSFLSTPITLKELKKRLSLFLDISEGQAEIVIKPFLKNSQCITTKYGGVTSYFPPNIIIESKNSIANERQYCAQDFQYKELDFKTLRFFKAPVSIVFMVNNKCLTDCVYCYANKEKKYNAIAFEEVKNMIDEAKRLDILTIMLVGGEFFLYPFWKEMLLYHRKHKYNLPLISTKIPINEETIKFIKQLDLSLQVSLDSLDSNILCRMLKVKKDYKEEIIKTIECLDAHDIDYHITTVLTQYNDDTKCLDSIYRFLIKLKKIKKWEIRIAIKSLYSKKDFYQIRTTMDSINNIDNWVKKRKDEGFIQILWNKDITSKYFKSENGSRSFQGANCSANYSNIFILPDGKVSICEQLYWNENFIIGDIRKQTIEEIWNSSKALDIAFPRKENFREECRCKTCKLFEECLHYPNKCFPDVLKAYGVDNWDYPDPRCIKAPDFIYNLLPE